MIIIVSPKLRESAPQMIFDKARQFERDSSAKIESAIFNRKKTDLNKR